MHELSLSPLWGKETNMSTFLGIVIMVVFVFLVLQFGFKWDIIGWIKKNIFKK